MSRVSTKGQVTIPLEIRERLRLDPGTEVEFVLDGDAVRIVKSAHEPGRGRRLVEHMTGRLTTGMTTDELMALTRGE